MNLYSYPQQPGFLKLVNAQHPAFRFCIGIPNRQKKVWVVGWVVWDWGWNVWQI